MDSSNDPGRTDGGNDHRIDRSGSDPGQKEVGGTG